MVMVMVMTVRLEVLMVVGVMGVGWMVVGVMTVVVEVMLNRTHLHLV